LSGRISNSQNSLPILLTLPSAAEKAIQFKAVLPARITITPPVGSLFFRLAKPNTHEVVGVTGRQVSSTPMPAIHGH
jgi:hypothetical protein